MIITKLSGGLGNQLFQYATARRLAHVHDTVLKLDYATLSVHEVARRFELDHFNIHAEKASAEEIAHVSEIDHSKKKRWLWNARHRFGLNALRLVREKGVKFEPRVLLAPDNVYLHGHWQSENYFKDISDLLHREFSFKEKLEGKNVETVRGIAACNSVSLHVRRQDYVKSPTMSEIYDVCGPEYYANALRYVGEKIPTPHVFVFSDDIEWVKKNMDIKLPVTFVDWNDDIHNYHDLELMSLCKHNIIANSSFSWWGAWLNQNPEKIVVAPKRWFNVRKWNGKDRIPSTWIQI